MYEMTDADLSNDELSDLMAKAETVKAELSYSSTTNTLKYHGNFYEVSRYEYENECLWLFKKATLEILDTLFDNLIKKQKFSISDVDLVLLTGGSSQTPRIRKLVEDFMGNEIPVKLFRPRDGVACGAAYFGHMLKRGNTPSDIIQDRLPTSYGIPVVNDEDPSNSYFRVILEENSLLPVENTVS